MLCSLGHCILLCFCSEACFGHDQSAVTVLPLEEHHIAHGFALPLVGAVGPVVVSWRGWRPLLVPSQPVVAGVMTGWTDLVVLSGWSMVWTRWTAGVVR
jgi:hypothetical protein